MSRKISTPIAIAIVVAGVVLVWSAVNWQLGLFPTSSFSSFIPIKKSATANWETYDNEVYGGYRISYPNDWYLTYSYKSYAVISSVSMA